MTMKTLISILIQWITALIFLTFSVPAFSQAWVPLGTEWSFTNHPSDRLSVAVSKIKAVEQSMDDGRIVTKIAVESQFDCPYEPDWVYAYYTPEKEVFMKLPGDTAYVKYFDFTVQPGDWLSIPFKLDTLQEEMRVYVESVDTIFILNEPRIRVRGWITLKWLIFVEQPEFCWIEGMGDVYTSMFLGQSLHCGSEGSSMFGFRCFTDTEEGIYNPFNIDCDEAMSTSTRSFDKINDLKFYPNPVKNELFFDSGEFDRWNAEFYHISGQLMHTGSVSGKSIVIPESLAPGLYIIHLNDNLGKSRVFKIIKQ